MIEFDKDRFDLMFSPKNIAIIGVSRNFMKWGNMIFANIYTEKYYEKGKIYLIKWEYWDPTTSTWYEKRNRILKIRLFWK